MYKRLSAIMFPITAILLIGAVYWGYQENQEKNSILIKAENSYQRAFHNLSYHLDQLHNELGNTLAISTNSKDYQRRQLVNVWRITSEAQSEISQLPLSLLTFHETEKFLANIADFTYHTAVRDFEKEPLSEKEMKTLQTLYKHSDEISKNVLDVQDKVIENHLRWMDVEVAVAQEDSVRDNAIIDGFKLVDQKVGEYEDVDFGPSSADTYETRSIKQLSGKMMTKEEILQKAQQNFALQGSDIQVVHNGKGTEFQSYSVTAQTKRGPRMQMDYTTKGGHLVYFIKEREIKNKQIDQNQAIQSASQFLKKNIGGAMEPISYDEYENVASITFATKKNNVVIYPEKLVVRVALDNGEVAGLSAADYVYEKKDRKWSPPKLSKQEAAKSLSDGFKVSDSGLALIQDDFKKEVLAYQFVGRSNSTFYRVFIDANTGNIVKIENLQETKV
ncbi:germination protein YpeB [Marinicrinis lubricantis]|uniref:Germination protein YpeB n=1 Tax=Marinicrinis lubricantis TaxID=2086470 RepID=A0ABW1ISL1_9BACL